MPNKIDGSIELNELLLSIQHELVAHREILGFTLGTLQSFGHTREEIANALRGLGLAPPVQGRVDLVAKSLLDSIQIK